MRWGYGSIRERCYLGSQEQLQRDLKLTDRDEPLKLRPNNSLSVHDEHPGFGGQVPLCDRGKELVGDGILPDLLMCESDLTAIDREQQPHDIYDWPTHTSGAKSGGCKPDDLRRALRDRISDANLRQPQIEGFARVDLAQLPDVAGDEIAAPWSGGSHRWGAGGRKNREAKASHLRRSLAPFSEHLEAPWSGLGKGDLRHVETSYRRSLRMHMAGAIGMEMHLPPLFNDL